MPDVARGGVRVLIVDDSPVAREVLKSVLEVDTSIRVIGMAGTGREAVELTARLKPDLVTMDLVMPGMDGMEATQRIMARHPTPILFFSSFFGPDGVYSRSDALAAGALDVVEKPMPMLEPRWPTAGALVQKVKSLAQVPVDLSRPLDDHVSRNIAQLEYHYIRRALKRARGNVSRCARLCGLSRQNVNRELHKLEKSGFLRIRYGAIEVVDLAGLQNFSRGE